MEQAQTLNPVQLQREPPDIFTEVIAHLCEGECHAFGDLIEWCESRGDCTVAVVCPSCSRQWIIDDDELDDLKRWTAANGAHLGCGVSFDA